MSSPSAAPPAATTSVGPPPSPPSRIKASARPATAGQSDNDSGSSSDSDDASGRRLAGTGGKPSSTTATASGRRSLVLPPSSPPEHEPTALELDAMVERLRQDARAEAGVSSAGGPAVKKRTYGRAGGLKKHAPLAAAAAAPPDDDLARGQDLFGSSSLTTIATSDPAPLPASSQRTATVVGTSDGADDSGGTPRATTAARAPLAKRPSRVLPSSDEDDSDDDDDEEAYTFAARRRPRPSGATVLASSSSAVLGGASSPGVVVARPLPPPPPPAAALPTGKIASANPSSTTTTPRVPGHPTRPFRPPPAALTRPPPLGLGPADMDAHAVDDDVRDASPDIGEFGTSQSAERERERARGGERERRRIEAVRIKGGDDRSSSRSSSASPTRSPSQAKPKAKSKAKNAGMRRALVDSDDEDGVVLVPLSEMVGLFGSGDGGSGRGSGDEDEEGEAWVGDVVKAVKDKRRGARGGSTGGAGEAKPLSKKEMEQMKLEQARMQRERRTTIGKPEQETRDMLTFLRRKREAAAARKSQVNPLNTQLFFRDSPVPPPPTAAADDVSSDPIVSSNPALAPRPTHSARTSLGGTAPPAPPSDDDADEFDDVDALFAKKREADADRARREAADAALRDKRERLRAVKERAAAAAAAAGKSKARADNDSDSDLEIEPVGRPVPATAAAASRAPAAVVNKEVVAKAARNSIVHRNLAKYGVVHKGRPSVGSAASASTGAGTPRRPRTDAPPTESQIEAAGRTFGHGSSSPAGPSAAAAKRPGSKAHVARPVSKDDLVANLLAKAKAQTRRAIAEKDAKYGRGAADDRWKTREGPDWERMLEQAQTRKSDWILVAEDEDDAEDEDFDPDAPADDDGADDAEAAEEEAAGSDVDGESSAGPVRLLDPADAEAGVLDPMEAEDEAPAADAPSPASHHSDKENALPTGARPAAAGADREGRPSSGGVLEARPLVADGEDEEEEEESFPMQRAKRRRTVLFDEDEDEDEDDGENAPPRSAASSARRLSFGAPLSPLRSGSGSASPKPSPAPTSAKLASTASVSFGGGGGGSDDDGFGDGGFSQFFEPTQAATVATERTDESQPASDGGGMDLDGEGGFSQFFDQTQAPASPKIADAPPKDGALNRLRALANDAPLRPEMSQLPSLDVSASQQEAVADALARDAAGRQDDPDDDVPAEAPRSGKKMFINQDGFFTQNEPSTFVIDETPSRPTQVGTLTTPATPSIHAAAAGASSSSSPAKPGRRLVRRQDHRLVDDDDNDDDLEVVEDSQPASSARSPLRLASIFQRPEKKERDPNKPRKPRGPMTDATRALLEDQAVESDEDDGFGAFGKTKASDDEDDEDQDKVVEGLVNDEQMTDDAEKRADEERTRLARELAEADDEAQMKIAQDVTTGEFRKKKKDALSMEMDSDEEDQYGTSKRTREERRRKRKLDKLDEMERLEFDPETAPFAKMYADTYNNDDDEYGNLLSDDDETVPNSEANDFAESLGIPRSRHQRRRIVASPEPLTRKASTTSIRMYDDGSDDDDEDGLTESQVQIRRGGAHRPQAHPIQQDDEAYSLGVSTGYSNSDSSQKHSQGRRQKLELFARDESQNMSNAKGGSTSSVTGLKRKASLASVGSAGGSGSQSSVKRRVSQLVASASDSMLGGRLKKHWEK